MGHFVVRVSLALVMLVVASTLGAGAIAAADPASGPIVADLEGEPIPASDIPNWHCHDLEFPQRDDLSSIGWNDMISSFKAMHGLSGHFATDALNGGRLFPTFCCNTQVPYVGDAWNDLFSSVYAA